MPITTQKSLNASVSAARVMHAGGADAANVTSAADRNLDPNATGRLLLGVVARTNPKFGTVDVDIGQQGPESSAYSYVTCALLTFGDGALTHMPLENDRVLCWVRSGANDGYVLGTCAEIALWGLGQAVPRFAHPEGGVDDAARDLGSEAHYTAADGRVADLQPGEVAVYGRLGTGIEIRQLVARLLAAPDAAIEFYLLDGLVRLLSNSFQHFSAIGEQRIWNAGGKCSAELLVSGHQHEVDGALETAQALIDAAETPTTMSKALPESAGNIVPRMIGYAGHVAGCVQLFAVAPRAAADNPDASPGEAIAARLSDGLFHAGVDADGRLIVRSASDIIICRNDHIQVPLRKREHTDPAGGRLGATPVAKSDFTQELPAEGRHLHDSDALAWMLRNLYRRFADHTGSGDFTLEESAAVPTPGNEYDPAEDGTAMFAENANKSSMVIMRKDGGITVRDAQGAEISLSGGRIIISAPNGIELRSGTSVVALAEEDVVMRAKDSVDIVASNHDVRIKAERNLHALSNRSILLECTAESLVQPPAEEDTGDDSPAPASLAAPDLVALADEETPPEDETPVGHGGEAFSGTGIVIKAADSGVAIRSKQIQVSGSEQIVLEALDSEATISAVCTEFKVNALEKVIAAVDGGSALVVDRSQALLSGTTAMLVGKESAIIFEDDRIMVPLTWTSAGVGPQAQIDTALEPVIALREETEWLPYDHYGTAVFDAWRFTYRSSLESGTSAYTVYESWWMYIRRRGGAVVPAWTDAAVHDTRPWPGAARYMESMYFNMQAARNLDTTGLDIAMEQRSQVGGDCIGNGFGEYGR